MIYLLSQQLRGVHHIPAGRTTCKGLLRAQQSVCGMPGQQHCTYEVLLFFVFCPCASDFLFLFLRVRFLSIPLSPYLPLSHSVYVMLE